MLRSTLPSLLAFAGLLLASGCNLERPEMDDAILPATATAALPRGQELFSMFEGEKQNAAMAELPALF